MVLCLGSAFCSFHWLGWGGLGWGGGGSGGRRRWGRVEGVGGMGVGGELWPSLMLPAYP